MGSGQLFRIAFDQKQGIDYLSCEPSHETQRFHASIFAKESLTESLKKKRPDTRHKMHLVCVLFTFENTTGPTDGPTDGRTDTTSYRDARAHLKSRC